MSKPFLIDIFVAVIAKHYFNGDKSVATANPERFISSIDQLPNKKEIPEAMLIMATVSVSVLPCIVSYTYSFSVSRWHCLSLTGARSVAST